MNINIFEDLNNNIIQKAPISNDEKKQLTDELRNEIGEDTIVPCSIAQGSFDFSQKANLLLFYIFKNFEKIDEKNIKRTESYSKDGKYVEEIETIVPKLTFKMSDILRDLDYYSSGKNREDIRKAFKELRDKSIFIRYRDEKKSLRKRTFSIIKAVDTNDREIVLEFDINDFQTLKYCRNNWFEGFMFNNFKSFSSKYTQRIFAIVISELWQTNKYRTTIKTLNNKLKTNYLPSEVKNIIIKPSLEEMTEKNPIYDFSVSEIENSEYFFIETIRNDKKIYKLYNKYIEKINDIIIKENEEKTNIDKVELLPDYSTILKAEEKEKIRIKEIKEKAKYFNEKIRETTSKDLHFTKMFEKMLEECPLPDEMYLTIIKYVSEKEIIKDAYLKKIINSCYINGIKTAEEFYKDLDKIKEKAKKREEFIKSKKEKNKINKIDRDEYNKFFAEQIKKQMEKGSFK